MSQALQTSPPPAPTPGPRRGPRLPEIPGPLETLLSGWRRLRRMSTALGLLFAMAAAAVVATFIPQEPVIADTVEAWRAGTEGPGATVARAFDALGFFDVFGSWWFLALTVLLFTSLTGCLAPRYRAFAKVARRAPAAGRNLERLSARREYTSGRTPEEILAGAERVLRRRRFRRRRVPAEASPTGAPQLAAERGHWREGGSLLFHTAFYLLLVGIVIGQARGFTGQVNLVEGQSFVDTRVSYEVASPGRWWTLADHRAFRTTLHDFTVDFWPDGTPREFTSSLTLESADSERVTTPLRVNHPVRFEGMTLYQSRWGMAPRVVVRSTATGQPLFEGSVKLLQRPDGFWTGTQKVTIGGTTTTQDGTEVTLPQMALDLAFLPDARLAATPQGPVPAPGGPQPENPLLFGTLYAGGLGLERPVPVSELRPDWEPAQQAGELVLAEGQAAELLDGALTVEFAELDLWSGFQVSHQPGRAVLLTAGLLLLAGLVPSLYAYRRRIWVDARPAEGGGTHVVVAGVALQRTATFTDEFADVADEIGLQTGEERPV